MAKKRKFTTRELMVRETSYNLLAYLVYLTSCLIKTFYFRGTGVYFFNYSIDNMLFGCHFQNSLDEYIGFEKIVTLPDYWDYLERYIVLKLYDEEDPRYFIFKQNLFLGPPRLRQLRVRPGTCKVDRSVKEYFDVCYGEYNKQNEDTTKVYEDGTKYVTSNQISSTTIRGKITNYSGGGYIVSLGYGRDNALAVIRDLKKRKWIDRGTRLVVLELSIYNNHENLYGSIKIYLELSSSGNFQVSHKIRATQHSIGWSSPKSKIIVAINILYFLFHIYYSYLKIRMIYREGVCAALKDKYLYIEGGVAVGGWFCFYFEFWHQYKITTVLQIFRADPTQHLSLDRISDMYVVYVRVLAMCLFGVIMKSLKFLYLCTVIGQLSATVGSCVKDLLGFFVVFSITASAYSLMELLLYGNRVYEFRNVPTTIFTTYKMLVGGYDFRVLLEDFESSPFVFASFNILQYFILVNMFLAILCAAYNEERIKLETEFEHTMITIKEVVMFLLKRLYYCLTTAKMRKMIRKRDKFSPSERKRIVTEEQQISTQYHNVALASKILSYHCAIIEKKVEILILMLDDLIYWSQKRVQKYEADNKVQKKAQLREILKGQTTTG